MLIPIHPIAGKAHVRAAMFEPNESEEALWVDAIAVTQGDLGQLWYIVNVADGDDCYLAYAQAISKVH